MDGIGRRRSGIGGSIHLKSRPASEERNVSIALYAPSLPQVVLLSSSCQLRTAENVRYPVTHVVSVPDALLRRRFGDLPIRPDHVWATKSAFLSRRCCKPRRHLPTCPLAKKTHAEMTRRYLGRLPPIP